ncbi:tRNA1(Val) (adenine(37)-N6)-methyltransferase [Spiroplasma poulsonii]|uniref:tRNA1(Val) (Adenine(37)-N6)-methyltransferase n=1 Tax=Spiroplasma poulsonii TaxID=2138 RepID=A0A433ETA3_9MOLU|nr:MULTISPECIES: tRNA1(Val) (adenine(37)-N6)-methyltransferase [Spiroplasma]MBH8622727.1 SAM-dependent methyltransferase [Spiroplasma sp. hyd1]MBW3058018.1 SAM-dependent methyltransferase [Spiroplasma poulsonii]RUP78140.1 tRNA1(Val) (adenine(37)-N6)-methyltransferase [Spiroplasma poulsonii]UNF61280.1 tRNA1(Val) (adenine(37)-N6)-methyltransferase [Spiroplasma poulsonii]
MKVLNDLLDYEGIKINQRTDMFIFSLDTVLLARFATLNAKTKNILDIGTNNAAIPLILSTLTSAAITGIELQQEAVQLAEENVLLNQKTAQIKIVHDDINEYVKTNTNFKYDLILCNPPFFKIGESKLNEKNKLLVPARHETTLTLEDIIFVAKKLIANRGYFAIIHRTTRLFEITALLIKYGFNIKRLQFIHPFQESEANNVLIEARFQGGEGLIIEKPIVVHNNDYQYSDTVLKLFRK